MGGKAYLHLPTNLKAFGQPPQRDPRKPLMTHAAFKTPNSVNTPHSCSSPPSSFCITRSPGLLSLFCSVVPNVSSSPKLSAKDPPHEQLAITFVSGL